MATLINHYYFFRDTAAKQTMFPFFICRNISPDDSKNLKYRPANCKTALKNLAS